MKNLLLITFIIFLISACGHKSGQNPIPVKIDSAPTVTTPTTISTCSYIQGIVYWNPVTTMVDGTNTTAGGYTLQCSEHQPFNVGNVTEYNLHNILVSEGTYTCAVAAYSNAMNVISSGWTTPIAVKVEKDGTMCQL